MKSKAAKAPSDLTRTDWIEYDPANESRFRRKLGQALDQIDAIASFTADLLELALEAPAMDCAIAFERASKAFLLTGDPRFLDAAKVIRQRLVPAARDDNIADLDRVRDEVALFIRQGRRAVASN